MEDTAIGGQTLKAGEKVAMWYASANRDETHFPDPYRFDLSRDPNPQVGYGAGGPHFCLGANLARREITLAFRELFEQVPDLHAVGEPDMLLSVFIHGIKRLNCEFTPRSPRAYAHPVSVGRLATRLDAVILDSRRHISPVGRRRDDVEGDLRRWLEGRPACSSASPVTDPVRHVAYTGTAPVELSSGGRTTHRLSRRGSRRPNHALHSAANTRSVTATGPAAATTNAGSAKAIPPREAVRALSDGRSSGVTSLAALRPSRSLPKP